MHVLLQTERLLLRRFEENDAEHLVSLDSDPAVMRHLTGGVATPRTVIQHEILPRFLHYDEESPGLGFWAAMMKPDGRFIGWFSLRPAPASADGALELGFRLVREVWGQGMATEGARALIRLAFLELGAERVFATTYQDNLASRRVLEKLGMRLTRRFRPSADDLRRAGTFDVGDVDVWDGDDVEYSLRRQTYLGGLGARLL